MEIFYIGGSPCSGKSTVAEEVRRLCAQLGLSHLLTDGSVPPEERLRQVASLFHLDE